MCGDWIDWRDGGERDQDDLQGFGLAIGQAVVPSPERDLVSGGVGCGDHD